MSPVPVWLLMHPFVCITAISQQLCDGPKPFSTFYFETTNVYHQSPSLEIKLLSFFLIEVITHHKGLHIKLSCPCSLLKGSELVGPLHAQR